MTAHPRICPNGLDCPCYDQPWTAPDVLLAWQICTGCANTREVPMKRDEVVRRMAFKPEDRPKHEGCYPLPNATRSEWVTNGARVMPHLLVQ